MKADIEGDIMGDNSKNEAQIQATGMRAMWAMVFSFLAMLFAIIALGVIAGKDVSTECNFDHSAITTAITDSENNVRQDVAGLNAADSCPAMSAGRKASGLEMVAHAYNNMGQIGNGVVPNADRRYEGLASQLQPIGTHRALIAEASDAGDRMHLIKDGQSGDVDFPHGHLRPIVTVGEYDANSGYIPVGVPDGQGVYLKDMNTVRLIFQAESYGHISRNPSWYLPVNDGAAHFTGSHIAYVDYDKTALHNALNSNGDIAPTVKMAGELFDTVINLAGDPVDDTHPHYGDTGANGVYVSAGLRAGNEYTFHSFCSAHLEEAHQWGPNLGVEDTMFMTVEEWTALNEDNARANGFVGLSAHVVDIAEKVLYAVGAFGMGGYEKIVEFNCGNPNYVCFSPSGYNGAFGGAAVSPMVDRKKAQQATRADGTDWVFPQNIVPARVYVGVKGYKADGTACGDDCGFLARNGLEFGKVYGFAVPEATEDRDAWHVGKERSTATAAVDGVFAPTAWQWDGAVRDFEFDGAWEFQEAPLNAAGHKFWTAKGRDAAGKKTEHNAPDPRGRARFVQGSTAGYYGIYDLSAGSSSDPRGVSSVLGALAAPALPDAIPARYELLEGETDITAQIRLNGKGVRADGNDQTHMFDGSEKATFEDIDGLYWFGAGDGRDFLIIQEDGGNRYGERIFISELPPAGVRPTYHFMAQAGGSLNTRNRAGVGIPVGTHGTAASNEFSGASDLSGPFAQTALGGAARHAAANAVPIQDKWLAVGLQSGSMNSGVVHAFGMDRGGQVYAYKPANLTAYPSA